MPIFVNASFLSIYPATGLSRYALAMSMALQEQMDSEIVFLTNKSSRTNNEQLLNVKIIGDSRQRLLWEQYDLPRYLRKIGSPLLINFGNTAPITYSNQIVSILDVFYHHAQEIVGDQIRAYPFRDRVFYKAITSKIAKNCRSIITISDYSKSDIVKTLNVRPEQVDVVYPTVSDLFLEKSEQQIQNKSDYILGVSSITPHKNFDSLIQAFNKSSLTNTRLVIAGNIPKNSFYDSFKDNRIEFTGFVDDEKLRELYLKAKFFVFPSKFEGFGIPPLEAMASGCPTLVSNATSMPEVCGEASLYINPYDIDSIANGISILNDDYSKRQLLIEKGYEQVKLYDKKISSKKLLEVIQKAIR
ncbi:glycosyltransferase family 4 protein [Spirosoma panaciterrae]|uniref:glycosyltransferase family 4 protein n=1 Tax=Spirosoma panaciterrae TaxID=496058 RepID=UPI0003604CF3|nr:glycosyltransferase family 1 protein [Spirosoma panaciterrae]